MGTENDDTDDVAGEEDAIIAVADDADDIDLDLLTDEEREALDLDDNGVPTDGADDDEGEAVAEVAEAADGAADDAGDGDGDSDEGEEPTTLPSIGDLSTRSEALKAEDEAIWEKFNDGELDDKEMREALAVLSQKQAALAVEVGEAEATKANWMKAWTKNVQAYIKEYPELVNDDNADEFDAIVRGVTGSRDPKIAALPMLKKLQLAHDTYAARADAIGKTVPQRSKTATQAAAKVDAKGDEPKLPPKGDKPKAPITIRTIPQADPMAAADGKFAALDRISDLGDADAYEKALARLTPDERDSYFAS